MAKKPTFVATDEEFALFASEGWSIFTEDGVTMEVMRIDDPERFAEDRSLPVPPQLHDDLVAFEKARKYLILEIDEDERAIIVGRKV